jgi:hypothetical protein
MRAPFSPVEISVERSSYSALMATGGIVIAAIMLLVFPVLIMFGGAIWSALMGRLLVDDADARASGTRGDDRVM